MSWYDAMHEPVRPYFAARCMCCKDAGEEAGRAATTACSIRMAPQTQPSVVGADAIETQERGAARTGVQGQGLQARRQAADGDAAEGLMHEVDALRDLAPRGEEDEDVAGHLGAVDVKDGLDRRVQVVRCRRLHMHTDHRRMHPLPRSARFSLMSLDYWFHGHGPWDHHRE